MSTRAPLAVSMRARAGARRAARIIERADQPRLMRDEGERFALIEGMIAERDAIGAGGEEIGEDLPQ